MSERIGFVSRRGEPMLSRENITPETVCHYYANKKELEGSVGSKAKSFVKKKRIVSVGENAWHCLPIQNYNKTTYRIEYKDGKFSCNCQSNALYGKKCSHIVAVKLFRLITDGVNSLEDL